MQGKNKISNRQIKALLVTTIVGVGVLSLPSDVAMVLNNGGWIGILLGGLISIPFIMVINKLFSIDPGKSFFQISCQAVGRAVTKVFLFIIFAYFIMVLAYTVRLFSEVIKAYLLENTPTEVIILTMLLATAYIARSKIEVLARFAVMIYPIIVGFVIFLLVVNLPNNDFTNILPLFDIDYKLIPRAVYASFFSYAGYEILLFAQHISEDESRSLKYSVGSMFMVIGIYLVIFFITLSQYGIHQLKREIWPTIAVIKEIDLPGYFLENLDGVVMAVWVLVVYATVGPFFYACGVTIAEIFGFNSHKLFIPFLIPLIYIIALIPDNLVTVNEILGSIGNYLNVAAVVIVPIIILIAAYVRKGREKV